MGPRSGGPDTVQVSQTKIHYLNHTIYKNDALKAVKGCFLDKEDNMFVGKCQGQAILFVIPVVSCNLLYLLVHNVL